MGFFDDDDESPPINMNSFIPNPATNDFSPINFLQLMDDVSGEEFSFVRGTDGQRYLELKERVRQKEAEYNKYDTRWGGAARDRVGGELNQLKAEMEIAKNEPGSNGLKAGQIMMRSRNTRNRIPLDSPITVGDVDVALTPTGQFDVRYAAAIADVSARLRGLAETIEVAERTDPALLEQNKPIIDAFKAASKQAMDKGFDIKQNGLDMKLTKMGLSNSSTALGSQIALARQRTDTEIDNALKEAQLAQGLKQQSISNMFKLGGQLVQEGAVNINARTQDIAREEIEQRRSAMQAKLNLEKEQQKVNAEVSRRQIGAQLAISRNPMHLALPFLSQTNDQGLRAIQGDNSDMLNLQKNQLWQSQLEQDKFRNDQAAQSDPMGKLLTTGLSAGIGAFTGGYGTSMGLKAAGLDPEKILGGK